MPSTFQHFTRIMHNELAVEIAEIALVYQHKLYLQYKDTVGK